MLRLNAQGLNVPAMANLCQRHQMRSYTAAPAMDYAKIVASSARVEPLPFPAMEGGYH